MQERFRPVLLTLLVIQTYTHVLSLSLISNWHQKERKKEKKGGRNTVSKS
jgi:hypothetical protein